MESSIDREKVIKGLEHCEIGGYGPCYEKECPYYQSHDCIDELKNDILALLKEQESEEKRILKIVWDILHNGVSTDTEADQDWVYEQIRNKVHKVY
jgi:hypothetical protein